MAPCVTRATRERRRWRISSVVELQQIFAIQAYLAGLDDTGRTDEAHDGKGYRRLTRAGLADQAKAFAGLDIERNIVYRFDLPGAVW